MRSSRILPLLVRCGCVLVLAVCFALVSHPSAAQDLAQRLILKDGSYQLVTKYEVHGDRVRYLSAERDEWEELPNALVDWPATEKYAKDRVTGGAGSPGAAELEKQFEAAREVDETGEPQVAPGLRLPEDSGVFLLDNFRGEAQLDELQQTEGDVNRKAQGSIFRDVMNPVASVKTTIELEGEHAAVQSHSDVPSFYIKPDAADQPEPDKKQPSGDQIKIRLDEPTPGGPQGTQQTQPAVPEPERFRIVRTQVKGGKRIIADLQHATAGGANPGNGQAQTQQNAKAPQKAAPKKDQKPDQRFVQATTTQVSGGWIKITPTESMPPGEYAIVEMKGEQSVNLFVWDFGVNPNAAGNKNPWVPEANDDAKPPAKPDASTK